jgi:PKD repeat protein
VPPTATAGTYTVAVEAKDQNGSPTRTAYLTLTVISGFMMSASQRTVAVQQGGTATYTLQISPQGGAFNSPITLTCTGLPPNTTSSFNSSRVIPGSAGSTVTLNVVTSTVAAAIPASNRGLWLAMLLPMAGWFFAGAVRQRRRPRLAFALTPLLLGVLLCSCGGGGASSSSPIVPPTNTATPTGTYTLTVTGTSGAVSQAIDLTLMVQ